MAQHITPVGKKPVTSFMKLRDIDLWVHVNEGAISSRAKAWLRDIEGRGKVVKTKGALFTPDGLSMVVTGARWTLRRNTKYCPAQKIALSKKLCNINSF